MGKRYNIALTTPKGRESFDKVNVEPILVIDTFNRTITGSYRFRGQATRKFQLSLPFEVNITETRTDDLMTFVRQRLKAQFAELAGADEVDEATNPDDDLTTLR